jgi:HSP20 family protein
MVGVFAAQEGYMKSLIPWRRGNRVFDQLNEEIAGLMQRFMGGPVEETGANVLTAWTPRVDVEETEKEIFVKVDLPGVDPKEVEITVVNDVLVLRGERKEEREEKKTNYHRVERFAGAFYREVMLPFGTDADKILATSSKGVITITVPKKPEVLPKKIAVKPQE